MPCFRGIGLSIATAADDSVFPEFPHPDGSSAPFRNFSADNNKGSNTSNTNSTGRPANSVFLSPRLRQQTSTAARHTDPTVSVYIPSSPDANFYFHYTVTQSPAGAKYLLFKVNINGCHVVSWGVNPSKTATGTTRHALFEPSARYQHDDNGVLMTEYGIESRCFRFVSSGAGAATSVADDGGLIEVRVFRAKARRRRAAQLGPCRGGDRYGVALISNGLLDDPQSANYYDYHLLDAKNAPYASFCFHYRSWDNLRLLQLAPPDKSDSLDCPSPEKVSLHPADCVEERCVFSSGRESRLAWSERPATKLIGRPLPDLPVSSNLAASEKIAYEYEDVVEGSENNEKGGQMSSDAESHRVCRSRSASAVSIAPSLCAYANGDDGFTVNTMELGSATKLEAIFHGTLSEHRGSEEKNRPEKHSTVPHTGTANLSTVYATDGKVKSLHWPRSPEKQQPLALFVFPFTDSLCKRGVGPPPNPRQQLPHLRGISCDLSPRSRGSPRPRRPHGGSLDHSFSPLRGWDLAEESQEATQG